MLRMQGFVYGMMAGAAIGTVVGAFFTPGSGKNTRAIKRTANRAIRNITSIADDFDQMMEKNQ